ncbi:putative nucleotidyltransferase [Amycolatopsis lexingtonensis]|uniref:Nucleotidyltransferase n=1 Tax=Amycolatopsis lexingtonensis TaxID=218822 RepID=A0ABR9I6B5_9PSEU|nr:nucleotidyltransferase domain-containing protein [Amycolatopsis lexingtonensis]MBE1498715.1 putative nucleotidyltransferase [Amycolatopsis lexingtonensis]
MELNRPLATVTPTLDGDVLAVLAGFDGTFTTGQLHRVLGRHSEEGIRKVLQRLVRQGVVHADRVGNAFAYRFNRDHLAAEHIAGLAGLRAKLLDRIETTLTAWKPRPRYAAVFGSAARGSMTAESDIDLLLVRPDDADEDRWGLQVDGLAADVSRWTGNDARILEFTVAEVAARGRDEPVLSDVVRDGLTVAGRHAWLAGQIRKRKS